MRCDWKRGTFGVSVCAETATVIRTVVDNPRDRDLDPPRLDGRPFCDHHAAEIQKLDKASWRARYEPIERES